MGGSRIVDRCCPLNGTMEAISNVGMKRRADLAGLVKQQADMENLRRRTEHNPNGKKTKGRVKIKMEFIDNKLRRYTTFSKRKTGIMKKAYELATLTGTQVMVLVASETGHVYTFATQKLQPMITSEAGKALIQTCLNSPDPGTTSNTNLRMTETGYEEQDLTYHVPEDREEEEWVSETKPQICETRESSPGTSLPGLEQCSSSSPPLMTIPPHVLTQLLTSALPPPR